jgi:tetratricopeptide (TPR) repeat protein
MRKTAAAKLWLAAGCVGVAVLIALAGCERKSVENYLSAGDQALQNVKLPEAEAAYQEAVKLAPNDPRTHIALGNLYVFERKLEPAQLEFMKVLDLDPKNAASHAALGNIYLSQSQLALAENQYRAAVALESARSAYRLELGQTLQKENKLAEAEAQMRTAIGLEPKNARLHLALANLLNSEPDRQGEAEAEYAQVRALDPHLLPVAPVAPAVGGAPAAPPATGAAPGVAAPPAREAKIKEVNKKFVLTKNSPVYERPDEASRVIAHVHRRKWVHVTGITGKYLRIKLRNGTVGFIPVSAAE